MTDKETVEKTFLISKALNNRLLKLAGERKDQDLAGSNVSEIIRECLRAYLPTIEAKMVK